MVRIALRTTGKKVTPFLTSAGSVARGKALAQHPKAKAAQNCISSNAGNKTAIRQCMARI
ncbi:MAG: hypothetical protein ACP5D2_04930 [Candidatus Nanoarchaeia archaeon]